MNIAVSNIAWGKERDAQVADLMRKHAITGLEVAPTKWFEDPTSVRLNNLRAAQKMWDNYHIPCIATQSLLFGHPEYTIFGTEELFQEMLEYVRKMLQTTHLLGAQKAVFGSPKSRFYPKNFMNPEKRGEAFFTKLTEYAEQAGVVVCVESAPAAYGGNFLTNLNQVLECIRRIGSPYLRLNLDTGIMMINQESPSLLQSVLAQEIGHVHLSEPNLEAVGRHNAFHQDISASLQQKQYDGWISIEMKEKPGENPLVSLEHAFMFAQKYYGNITTSSR